MTERREQGEFFDSYSADEVYAATLGDIDTALRFVDPDAQVGEDDRRAAFAALAVNNQKESKNALAQFLPEVDIEDLAIRISEPDPLLADLALGLTFAESKLPKGYKNLMESALRAGVKTRHGLNLTTQQIDSAKVITAVDIARRVEGILQNQERQFAIPGLMAQRQVVRDSFDRTKKILTLPHTVQCYVEDLLRNYEPRTIEQIEYVTRERENNNRRYLALLKDLPGKPSDYLNPEISSFEGMARWCALVMHAATDSEEAKQLVERVQPKFCKMLATRKEEALKNVTDGMCTLPELQMVLDSVKYMQESGMLRKKVEQHIFSVFNADELARCQRALVHFVGKTRPGNSEKNFSTRTIVHTESEFALRLSRLAPDDLDVRRMFDTRRVKV